MTEPFLIAYAQTVGREGAWSEDTDDPGKGTWKGISEVMDPESPIWPIVNKYRELPGFPGNMKNDPELEAATQSTYRRKYWKLMGLDMIKSLVIQCKLFDSGVNVGTGTVSLYLRIILNSFNRKGTHWKDIVVTTFMDIDALNAVNAMLLEPRGEDVLYSELNGWQRVYYTIGRGPFQYLVDQISKLTPDSWRETFAWGWEENRTPDYAEAKQSLA